MKAASRTCTTLLCLAGALLSPLSTADNASPPVSTSEFQQTEDLQFSVTSFHLSQQLPLANAEVEAILSKYRNRTLSIDELLAASKELEQAVRDRGWAFWRVVLPPQTMDNGEVFLQVINFKVGNIAVENAEHFSDRNILATLPRLKAGETPNIHRLAEDVRHANHHPSKRMELVFKEGEDDKSVDARVRVADEKPLSAFAIVRNTGNEPTGKWRSSAGFQHSNLFDRDHVLNATFTTSPSRHHHDDVTQFGISYSVPFYAWGGRIDASYAKSDVDSGLIDQFFDVAGAGHVSSVAVTKYLNRIQRQYDHEVTLSLEDKHFTSDVRFTPVSQFTPPGVGDVRSRPITVKWSMSRETAMFRFGAHAQYLRNLQGGNDNSQSAYDRVRVDGFGASVEIPQLWEAFRFGSFGNFNLPNHWRFNYDITGQYSEDALIPGEQFGLGGLASVRGYNERELAGDSGYVLRTELVAPEVRKFMFHWFVDNGYRDLEDSLGGDSSHQWLSSTGMGMRTSLGPFALRFDLGYPLENAPETDAGTLFLHSYLVWKY